MALGLRPLWCLAIAAMVVRTAGAGPAAGAASLWDPATPFPLGGEIQSVPGVRFKLVQAQTPAYRFLHETRLAVHGGRLFVSFSNAPKNESEPAQVIRGRTSRDGGVTWSEPAVWAGGLAGGERYETAPMVSTEGRLYAFVGRYRLGGRSSLGMEVHRYNESTQRFELLAESGLTPNFIPFVQPQKLANGNWIIGGHADEVSSAAVAISDGPDLTRWRVVRIRTPAGSFYPETALLIAGGDVTAVTRNDKSDRRALVAVSHDYGETFSAAVPADFPMSDSKPFAGTLSTGQRYLIFNGYPNRNADGSRNRSDLLIAVTKPGEATPLRKTWRIISDLPGGMEILSPEEASRPDRQSWAYPEAAEHDGTLYVVFSHNKKHGWLAAIPVESLRRP
ncbi:MAG: hypothetical protein EXS37_09615 [Opitutus sp.]|nr:hypothetical protein [Opitutus sp.]